MNRLRWVDEQQYVKFTMATPPDFTTHRLGCTHKASGRPSTLALSLQHIAGRRNTAACWREWTLAWSGRHALLANGSLAPLWQTALEADLYQTDFGRSCTMVSILRLLLGSQVMPNRPERPWSNSPYKLCGECPTGRPHPDGRPDVVARALVPPCRGSSRRSKHLLTSTTLVGRAGLRLVGFHEASLGHNRAPCRILDGREELQTPVIP
ncbi:hypothetical protein C8Q73DRAFT_368070 [Cubamyces lactineus]|nr:hypothetical protein C8Q73DRAFT_368070 [Cubamyces lactineus]